MLQALMQALKALVDREDHEFCDNGVHRCCGVSRDGGRDFATLSVEGRDMALYRAKDAGRNTFTFDEP